MRLAGAGTATLARGSLHAYHPEVGWTCLPGLDTRYVLPGNFDARVVCNRHGQRNPEVSPAKLPGTTRILVLGDSFMWGYGVENEEVLSNRLPRLVPSSEVVNLAASGYSTVQQLIRFESEGLAYAPDWTLLAFSWNDLGDNFDDKDGGRPIVAVAPDGAFEIVNRPVRRAWKSPRTQWLRHHSRLVAFVDYARQHIRNQLHVWRRERALRRHAAQSPRRDRRELRPMDFSPRELYGAPSPELELAWQAQQDLLRRIDLLTRQAGGRLLVVNVASAESMRPERFAREVGEGPDFDWDRPARRLAAICHELGVECLDLNPVFRRETDPDSQFFRSDVHWNPRGHEVAAIAVAKRIRALSARRE